MPNNAKRKYHPITDEAVKRAIEASNAATEQHIKDGNVSVPATVWMRAAIEAALNGEPACRGEEMTHGCTLCHRKAPMLVKVSVDAIPEPYETMVCPSCIVSNAEPSSFPDPGEVIAAQ